MCMVNFDRKISKEITVGVFILLGIFLYCVKLPTQTFATLPTDNYQGIHLCGGNYGICVWPTDSHYTSVGHTSYTSDITKACSTFCGGISDPPSCRTMDSSYFDIPSD